MSDHRRQAQSRTERNESRHDHRAPGDCIHRSGDWIALEPAEGHEGRDETSGPVAWYVHRDGLVQAATFGDGRAPAYFVVGRSQVFATAAAAREVLARAH